MRGVGILICSVVLAACGADDGFGGPAAGEGGSAGNAGSAGSAGSPVGTAGEGGSAGTGGTSGSGGASSGGASSGGASGSASGGSSGSAGVGGGAGSSGSAGGGGSGGGAWGELDPSHGAGGIQVGAALPGFDQLGRVADVAANADGDALYFGTKAVPSFWDFHLSRVTPTGSLKSSKTDDIGNHLDEGRAMAVYADGRVVMAGIANNGLVDRFGVLRYTAGGALDTSFEGDGKVVTGIGSYNQAYAVELDGTRVIVAGTAAVFLGNRDFALAVYDDSGALDKKFDSDGIATLDFGYADTARAIAVQPDGRYLVAGVIEKSNGGSDLGVARFNANGTPDLGFGQGGKVSVQIGWQDDVAPDGVIVEPNGSILVAGTAGSSNNPDFYVVRLLPNGALDPSLNADGKAIIDVGTQDHAHGFVRLTSGDLAIVGTSTGQNLTLVRLDSAGSPLSGFGSAGVVSLPRNKPARALTLLERTGTLLLIGAELEGSQVRALSASIFD